jgi:hypothetical protein
MGLRSRAFIRSPSISLSPSLWHGLAAFQLRTVMHLQNSHSTRREIIRNLFPRQRLRLLQLYEEPALFSSKSFSTLGS